MKDIKLNSKGVAGLDLVLSVITMLFVIGLLVMIYALMGGALQTASYDKLTTGSVINETHLCLAVNGTSFTLNKYVIRDAVCGSLTAVYNGTNGILIGSSNFTQTGCNIVNSSSMARFNTTLLYNYPYTYTANNPATDIMNDTVIGIADVPDWFPIVIVIVFMVVLILLTVMIVRAVRGSGLMGGEIGA